MRERLPLVGLVLVSSIVALRPLGAGHEGRSSSLEHLQFGAGGPCRGIPAPTPAFPDAGHGVNVLPDGRRLMNVFWNSGQPSFDDQIHHGLQASEGWKLFFDPIMPSLRQEGDGPFGLYAEGQERTWCYFLHAYITAGIHDFVFYWDEAIPGFYEDPAIGGLLRLTHAIEDDPDAAKWPLTMKYVAPAPVWYLDYVEPIPLATLTEQFWQRFKSRIGRTIDGRFQLNSNVYVYSSPTPSLLPGPKTIFMSLMFQYAFPPVAELPGADLDRVLGAIIERIRAEHLAELGEGIELKVLCTFPNTAGYYGPICDEKLVYSLAGSDLEGRTIEDYMVNVLTPIFDVPDAPTTLPPKAFLSHTAFRRPYEISDAYIPALPDNNFHFASLADYERVINRILDHQAQRLTDEFSTYHISTSPLSEVEGHNPLIVNFNTPDPFGRWGNTGRHGFSALDAPARMLCRRLGRGNCPLFEYPHVEPPLPEVKAASAHFCCEHMDLCRTGMRPGFEWTAADFSTYCAYDANVPSSYKGDVTVVLSRPAATNVIRGTLVADAVCLVPVGADEDDSKAICFDGHRPQATGWGVTPFYGTDAEQCVMENGLCRSNRLGPRTFEQPNVKHGNSAAGFFSTNWREAPVVGARGAHILFSSPSGNRELDLAQKAKWIFPQVPQGEYYVDVSFPVATDQVVDAEFSVYVGMGRMDFSVAPYTNRPDHVSRVNQTRRINRNEIGIQSADGVRHRRLVADGRPIVVAVRPQ